MAKAKKAAPKAPTKAELWPKPRHPHTWIAADDKKGALKCLDIVSKNKSTALDSEFPVSGPRQDEAIIWSLSGAVDQSFVLDGHWLKSKRSPFREWIADPKTKLVYFSFPADADVIEKNAKVDCEPSFYADVKVEGWLRNNNKRRFTLKEEERDYLNTRRLDYSHTFGYFPRGKSKWVTISADLLWEGPLPEEMLEVQSHEEWKELFKTYAGMDAWGTHTLHRIQKTILKRWGYWDMYLKLDKPYTITLRHCSKRGVPVDFKSLNELDREVSIELLRHKTALRALAGKPGLVLDSQGKDLRKLIFEDWAWPTYDDLQTDSGNPQLNKLAWGRYATEEGFQFAKLMLPHNKLKTLKGTFINGIRNGVLYGPGRETSTLFSEYNQTGTRSGRQSSRKFTVTIQVLKHFKRKPSILVDKKVKAGMNMLNFPNKFNDSFGVRKVVSAPPPDDESPEGYDILCCDYSGFELWMILYWCHKWGIKSKMLRYMKQGKDVHSMSAVACLGLDCDWSEVKEKYPSARNEVGKRANFGLGYGAGRRVFARILGYDTRFEKQLNKAQNIKDRWEDQWPEMPAYQSHCVRLGYRDGHVPTIAGRRIWVQEGLESSDEGTVRHYENLCKNGPAQGSAADITKMAQNFIENDRHMNAMGYKQLYNVYDEIVGYVPKRHSEEALARKIALMKMPFKDELPFELQVEGSSAPNWYLAK